VWVDPTGQATPLPTPRRRFAWPRFSPDGNRIAVTLQEGRTGGVWIVDPRAGTLARLTREGGVGEWITWTPDGKSVVYLSDRSGPGQWRLYSQAADGAGDAEMLAEFYFSPGGFSGSTTLLGVAWEGVSLEEGNAIQSLDLSGAPELTEIVPWQAGVEKFNAVPSPDGRWLAYVSNESGRLEVYLTPLPGAGEKRLVSRDEGYRVAWVGDEIFFISASTLMVVEVTGPDAQHSEPKALFSVEPYWRGYTYTLPNWDVSPDGRHFVIMRFLEDPETAPPRHLNIVTNFFDELREKVPAER
jgi:dipeptidyl aminopeptidase/acylaminoacyl peptidase